MIRCIMLLILFNSVYCKATTFTYSNTDTGNSFIPLGYPVPEPIDSLTPVDGFRSYQSLNLRLELLSELTNLIRQVEVGLTLNQRPIYAYQIGDPDSLTHIGTEEGAALINGGIHAREWQTPEATTGYIEALFDGQGDQHLAQYILDNLNLVIIPVLNVDGFIQTQRFASAVTRSKSSPRDGRMRRKNMRDVDQDLDTLGDNQLGVDLNRNNSPFWATSADRSSDDPESIVHHGSGPASEPEIQALMEGAVLAGESRLRFYTDTHSFTQIYFAPFTSNTRRNNITTSLADVMRAANNDKYEYGPSSSGAGIGSTDEYFANTYNIPSYTLEIEPQSSAAEYGGFGVSHDGFILPASEVSRMRKETKDATFAGLYAQTDIPFLLAIEVWDSSSLELQLAYKWQTENQQRQLTVTQSGELNRDSNYQLRLIFNKPMRWLDNQQVIGFGDLSEALGIRIDWVATVNQESLEWSVDATAGQWLASEGFNTYKTDTFSVPFTMGNNFDWQSTTLLALRVDTTDFAGQGLDTNPSTIVDWQNGAWLNYEDTEGNVTTDSGGIDNAFRLIDDGSDLYSNTTTNPPIQPPVNDSSSSGGAWHPILALAMLLSLTRRLTVSPALGWTQK
jgi:hypothetical protein